jgi:DNA polymerase-1
MSDSPGSVYLIDAHALIYQMFHAIPAMNAPDGRPTNALFGVTRDLFWIHEEVRPTYLLCAFDMPAPTFRDAIYPDYKKHRPAPPDDLRPQVGFVKEVLTAMNLPVLGVNGYEADDVMATVAGAGDARGLDVYICTSDKDCRQLISDRVRILNLRKREAVDRTTLMGIWGVTPEQVVDFQALVGDSVDNVPGVPGVGEKTAAKLLQQYGTLDNLVAHADEIKQAKLKENLKAAIASGALEKSRSLVRLEINVPMPLDWENWRRHEWDAPRLLELMQGFGFRRFADQVRAGMKTAGAAKNATLLATVAAADVGARTVSGSTGDGDLFSGIADAGSDFEFGANAPAADGWDATYTLVDTPKAWKSFLAQLKKQKRFAVDLETTGLDPLRSEIVGLSFSWQKGEGYYVPVLAPTGDQRLDTNEVLDALRPILESPKIAKVNQNIKYDELSFRAHGVTLRGVAGDPMIAHYLLHAGERSHNLDDLTRNYFGHDNISITELIGKGKHQKTMDQVPTKQVCDYAAEDADAAWRLTETLEPQLEGEGLRTLYDELEIPLIEVLAELEFNGIRLDVPFLKELSEEMTEQLARIERDIHLAAGRPFNIASPKQLREVLFTELKLPVQKRTDLTGEASTDQETLEKLARLDLEKHPSAQVAVAIVEHRQVAKLKGTYVDALPELVNPKTGRLHTSFNQTVAETGRLSSSDPNLQNIPIRTEQGQRIRRAFLPQAGWKLLSADYSQIELRLLAHFCKDERLAQAFAEDRDVHAAVAAEIYKVPQEQVTPEQRRRAKTVNFGVLYGMSAFGLAERLNIPRGEADAFIDTYFARYPKVSEYQKRLLDECRRTGYVATILGRKRHFDPKMLRETTSYSSRNQAERQAINMEIQGSAADLMKTALLRVHRRLRDEKRQARMLLTVHDELVFEVPPQELQDVARLVREEMVGAMPLDVPLKVDVSAGDNWLETEELE